MHVTGEDLRIGLGLKSDVSDSYDVFDGNRGENTVKDIKLIPHLVGNEFNLNSFILKHYHYLKSKFLVQKKYPNITREIEERHKEMMQSMRCSREEKSNIFCMKSFGLKHYHYFKSKLLAQKKYPTIAREIEERHK